MKPNSRLFVTALIATLLLASMYGTRAHAFTNGQSASLVIGQADFNSSSPAVSQNGLNAQYGAVFDSYGNLWMSDYSNNRVLEFSSTPVPEFPTASLAMVPLESWLMSR